VVADQLIDLGSPNNRSGTVVPGVRLVTYRTTAGTRHRLVTDRHDLDAAAIIALYRARWRIELFFRWLKRQLKAVRPLGHSRAAVTLTVLICAIVALLTVLLDPERAAGTTKIAFARSLGAVILPAVRRDSG